MPENEVKNTVEAVPVQETPPETAQETTWEKFERERLSRRQALKKFGITTGMAVFAMFSVDDLARMVGKAMQQRAGDNRIANQLAKEFQQAGIAMATTYTGASCANKDNYDDCVSCCDNACNSQTGCSNTCIGYACKGK